MTLVILFLALLFSCGNINSKSTDAKEKAINLIKEKYSTAYISKPIFEFDDDLITYEKNKSVVMSNDYVYKHVKTVDENTTKDVGYILKYIAIIDGYTFVFVATFDKALQCILSNNLYENALYSSDIVDVSSVSAKE